MNHADDEERIRQGLRRSTVAIVILTLAAIGALVIFHGRDPGPATITEQQTQGPQSSTDGAPLPELVFTDITAESGIEFVHQNGAYGERLLPETMGGGVAFLDFDNDGRQDLLLVNSRRWPWREQASPPATSALYRNLGSGKFEDVSADTGLDIVSYGMGVAVGDYDGDGWVDVFLSAVGTNRLLKNIDGQRFVDVTAESGVAGAADAWSTSAAFFDYDRDGDLDLVVCNYVGWSPDINREVNYTIAGIGRAYGPPTDFAGTQSYLYRNDDGVFADVSAAAGIHVLNESTGTPVAKALAVLPVDVDEDGWLDLIVANDTVRNLLFINQQDGSFREVGTASGLAYDNAGLATGAMGMDAAYVGREHSLAIAIGNFANEMSSFYVRGGGDQAFSDDAIIAGVGAASRRALTFGLLFMDADLDGRPDLVAANGHVEPEINRVQSSQRYAQPAQMFWNCGPDCQRDFRLVEGTIGDLAKPRVGRGLAHADIDGDGDLDLVMTVLGSNAVLLRNDQQLGNHWLRVRLQDDTANSHGIGARVTVVAAETQQQQTVMPARSYLSQVELPLTFGLGESDEVETVRVRWPDGSTETWSALAANRSWLLKKGTGNAE